MIKVTINKKDIDIQELKSGTVVELANGVRAIVYYDTKHDNRNELLLISYEDVLSTGLDTDKAYSKGHPIVKVLGKVSEIIVEPE